MDVSPLEQIKHGVVISFSHTYYRSFVLVAFNTPLTSVVVYKPDQEQTTVLPKVTANGRTITSSTTSSLEYHPGRIVQPTPASVLAQWLAQQKARRQQVDDVCYKARRSQSSLSSRTLLQRFGRSFFKNVIVDDKHQVLYCTIPKVACSSWKTVLTLMTGRVANVKSPLSLDVHNNTFMSSVGLPRMNKYSPAEYDHLLRNYKKFVFVRHPLERLLSAYRDKFVKTDSWNRYIQHRFGWKIIKRYRNNPSKESLKSGTGVLFEEFARYVTDSTIPNRSNPHWDTFHSLCHPCFIHYDFIGKYETLDVDQDMILHLLFNQTNSSRDKVQFPKRNVKTISTRDLMEDFYDTLPKKLLTALQRAYDLDFRLFGYSS